jgi:isoleucyl-tRNA synthetase
MMSFTAEEIWGYLPKQRGSAESVHVAKFPDGVEILGGNVPLDDPRQREDWATLRAVREEVLKALEKARNSKLIGTSLEAQVTVTAAEPIFSVLDRYKDQLRYLFIVSAVNLQPSTSGNGTGSSGVTVEVSKAPGKKCERCWNYSTRVGEDPKYPTICERCSAALREIEGQGAA